MECMILVEEETEMNTGTCQEITTQSERKGESESSDKLNKKFQEMTGELRFWENEPGGKITKLDETGEKGFVLLGLSNWCSLWLENILLPFIFEDNSDNSTSVTNSRYLFNLWWLLQFLTHTFFN